MKVNYKVLDAKASELSLSIKKYSQLTTEFNRIRSSKKPSVLIGDPDEYQEQLELRGRQDEIRDGLISYQTKIKEIISWFRSVNHFNGLIAWCTQNKVIIPNFK